MFGRSASGALNGLRRPAREALSKALLGAVRDGGSRFQRSWGR